MTRSKLLGVAESILWTGNCLLLFLLLFEDYLELPPLIQVLGRMHPLVLHFPIVLILLALIVVAVDFSSEVRKQAVFQFLRRYLLLSAALFGLLTALMGVFLARENGYSGDTLVWHKWTGAGLVFLASGLYWASGQTWFSLKNARIGSVFVLGLLVFAGHFGASLTHGEEFVWAPLKSAPKPVALEDALLFDHVILPVLDQKCNSCHNPSKAKGELDMTTVEALLKGGKSGKIWTQGVLEESMLFKRVHLMEEDKKHMPPKGKPQLTTQEIALLEAWIRANLPQETAVVTLAPTDSVRIIAAGFLDTSSEEAYDFASADQRTIAELNHDYRTVVALAENSPALEASFFSPSKFGSESLEELAPVAEQLVGLNLNKMPVEDQQMTVVAKFVHLKRLNLNFSQISANGLSELKPLRDLKHISLAGTEVDEAAVRQLPETHPQLRSVVLWATPLTYELVEKLRMDFPGIRWIYENPETEADILQLNLPQLGNASNIFQDTMILNLKHPIREVTIRYTLDGSEPTDSSAIFEKNQVVLEKSAFIRAKAYKTGWNPSEAISFDIYQNRFEPDSVELLRPTTSVHPAAGAKTFFDKEQGKFNANSPAWANNWAGFGNEPMTLLLEYKNPVTVSSVGFRILVESSNVILPPEEVEVWAGSDPQSLRLVKKLRPNQPSEMGLPIISRVDVAFPEIECRYLKVVAKPVGKIGVWSTRKGGRGLLLVDEMFVN